MVLRFTVLLRDLEAFLRYVTIGAFRFLLTYLLTYLLSNVNRRALTSANEDT